MKPKFGHIYEAEVTDLSGLMKTSILRYEGIWSQCGHPGCKRHRSMPQFSLIDKNAHTPVGAVKNITLIREVIMNRPEVLN